MTVTVTKADFVLNERLANHFTLEARLALYDYFEQYEDETGEQIDFDPVAITIEYTEYASINEIKADYPVIEDLEDLYNYTQVIEFEEGIIIADF